ncbi:MAG: class I SAM-dependent methyltransferase [Chloroherpetonaceae bacterium]
MPTCIICGHAHTSSTYYTAKEMMFGMRDTFTYFECEHCGCVQIVKPPDDLSKYYPQTYYSYHATPVIDPPLKRFLKKQLTNFVLTGKGLIGWLIQQIERVPDILKWVKHSSLNLDSKILDVGCGAGILLLQLQRLGFKHLEGVDPFLANDIFYDSGVKIWKKELKDMTGSFDLIMFHHSLEHIPTPQTYLENARKLLTPNGVVLIRVPIAGTFAWKHYGVNWVQLDPPRHLFLPTIKSMNLLAEQCGFEIFKTEFDSSDFQFWGSEQYIKEIPLNDPRSYSKNPKQSIFSSTDIATFKARAEALNREEQGDSACFYLRKI